MGPSKPSEHPHTPSAGELDAAGVRAAAAALANWNTQLLEDDPIYWTEQAEAMLTAYLTTAPRSVPGVGEGERATIRDEGESAQTVVATFTGRGERLGAIRARAEAATPGPWRSHRSSWEDNRYDGTGWEHPEVWGIGAGEQTVDRNEGHFHPEDAVYVRDEITVVEIGYDRDYQTAEAAIGREADATFIAHAREDIPWLLAALTMEPDELARLRDAMEEIYRDVGVGGLGPAIAAKALKRGVWAEAPAPQGDGGELGDDG